MCNKYEHVVLETESIQTNVMEMKPTNQKRHS